MEPTVLFITLLAANIAFGQDLPLDLKTLLDGLQRHDVSVSSASKSRRSYQSFMGGWTGKMATTPQVSPGTAAFGVLGVCNYSTCCSTRTRDSIARRAEISATLLGKTGAPPLLACGSTLDGPSSVQIPCHAPLASQPFLRAVLTRVQLICHTLRSATGITPLMGRPLLGHRQAVVREEYKPFPEERSVAEEAVQADEDASQLNETAGEVSQPMGAAWTTSEPAGIQHDSPELSQQDTCVIDTTLNDSEDYPKKDLIMVSHIVLPAGQKVEAVPLHGAPAADMEMAGLQEGTGDPAELDDQEFDASLEDDEAQSVSIGPRITDEVLQSKESMGRDETFFGQAPLDALHVKVEVLMAENGTGVVASSVMDTIVSEGQDLADGWLQVAVHQTDWRFALLELWAVAKLDVMRIAISTFTTAHQWVVASPEIASLVLLAASILAMLQFQMILRLRAAVEKEHQERARAREEHDMVISILLGGNRGLRDEIEGLQVAVQQQHAARRAAMDSATMTARASTETAAQLVQRIEELQDMQIALAGTLAWAVQKWRKQGEKFAAALSCSQRRTERMVQLVAIQRASAAERARLQAEEARRTAEERHARDVMMLQAQLGEEVAAAQAQSARCKALMRDLRRRLRRNLDVWMEFRSCMVGTYEGALRRARAVIDQYQQLVAHDQKQLKAQVARTAYVNGVNAELTEMLMEKDRCILELEGQLSTATAALEGQRQRCNDLQHKLVMAHDELSVSKRELDGLALQLQETQDALRTARARTQSLARANARLEDQAAQFVKAVSLFADTEAQIASTRGTAEVLERQIAADRDAEARAKEAHGKEVSELKAELDKARREAERDKLEIGKLNKELDEYKKSLQEAAAELLRQNSEDATGSGTLASLYWQQSPSGAEQGDQRVPDHIFHVLANLLGVTMPLLAERSTPQLSPADVAEQVRNLLDHHSVDP